MAAPPVRLWRLLPHDRLAVEQLARSLDLPPLVAQLLLNRGVDAADHARRFLDAPFAGLHKPDLLPGVPRAVDRIFDAIAHGRKICIYGDYDVDGITGTSILWQTLFLLGAQKTYYLPDRFEEGYGLNKEALKRLAEERVGLVITVDCGIASLAEAEYARALGLELIITDHHEMKDTLPDASVLVHPRLPGTSYPFGGLCGAAVAFKLAWALAIRKCGSEKVTSEFRELLLDCVGLAALGVIADVVPLHDENRILVRVGLQRLRDKPPAGIQALCENAKIDLTKPIRSGDVGFRLAPRINAVGRLGQALMAVDLLTTSNRTRAVDLARHCEVTNENRQKLERDSVKRAREMIASEGRDKDSALVLASHDWHPGIVGLVAGRVAEQYARPALLVRLPSPDAKGDHARLAVGSGRSYGEVPLNEVLKACDAFLVGHGGHAAAAGFRLYPEQVEAFREQFCKVIAERYPTGMPAPVLLLDAEAPLHALTVGLIKDIDRLEPYGCNNRRPLFLAGDLQILDEPKKVGQGERHLQFKVRQGVTTMKAIGWNMGDRLPELMSAGGACSLAFRPFKNEWNGRVTVEMEVEDFQVGAETRLG